MTNPSSDPLLDSTEPEAALPEPVPPTALPGGDELAAQLMGEPDSTPALTESNVTKISAAEKSDEEAEVAASNEVAETLASLQGLIERQANQLKEVGEELKHKRESLKNIFDNDPQLGEAEAKVEVMTDEVKVRKSQLQTDPQVTSLKVQIGELNEQKKEMEETLSNHLVNYHQITNSTSFDTSDGDQWDFNIKAKIKARKNRE
jgi:chromosome segregation ATPase